MKYKRVLLKLSGEALQGNLKYGIDPERLAVYAEEILSVTEEGVEIAIVIGGGNIFRGMQGVDKGFDRIRGDYMGMLATIINAMALQGALEKKGICSDILSGIPVESVAQPMSTAKAIEYLEAGHVVLMAGGTGNPFFTTDSAAVLRALEIDADLLLKGTRVDGVYSADPEKHPDAVKFNHITFTEAYDKKLKIMDMTAFTLCRENKVPVIVFNMNVKGNLYKVVMGEQVGTMIRPS